MGAAATAYDAVVVDAVGFVSQGPAEAPVADGDPLDEEALGRADGLIFGGKLIEEFIEGVAILGRVVADDGVAGEEAVLKGVAAGAGLAFGGPGAGGFAGVGAIGGDSGGG
ncbi:MAG TPA: hypothetical protein PLL20_12105, partial [Phycisphaerae bacterium]|nr:hypothetical protein [Phycisphaerae bacterium]